MDTIERGIREAAEHGHPTWSHAVAYGPCVKRTYRYPSGMEVDFARDEYGNLRAVDFRYGTSGPVGSVRYD